jgi:hypothetical protein
VVEWRGHDSEAVAERPALEDRHAAML